MTLADFVRGLQTPERLWAKSVTLVNDDSDYCSHIDPLMPEVPNFAMFRIADGGGAEGVILVRKTEDKKIDAALLFAYDHESSLTANIEDVEGAEYQPALIGLPDEFAPALVAGSPLFWNYDGYPATSDNIFASAAAWFVNGAWHAADNLNKMTDFAGKPIDDTKMVRQFRSIFKGFGF